MLAVCAAVIALVATVVLAAPRASGAVTPATVTPKCPPDCPPPPGGGGGGESDPDKNKNNNGEHHGGTGDSTADTSGTPGSPQPQTPTKPATPWEETGPSAEDMQAENKKRRQEDEDRKRNERLADVMRMVFFCTLAQYPGLAEIFTDSKAQAGPSVLYGGAFFDGMCALMIGIVRSNYTTPVDVAFHLSGSDAAPDPSLTRVVLTSATPVSSVAISCGKQVTRRTCTQLRLAALPYRNAVAASLAAENGLAASFARWSAALAAGSPLAATTQAGAVKAYAGQLAAALAVEQAKARVFAAVLRASRRDLVLSGQGRTTAIQKLGAADALKASIVSALAASGVAASAADLNQTLKQALAIVPARISLTAVLTTPRDTASLTALHHSMTVYDAALLVRGLALAKATGDRLVDDLHTALIATAPAAHTAALAQFAKDGAAVTGPAGALLAAAAQGLS